MSFPSPSDWETLTTFFLQSDTGKTSHLKDLIEASDNNILHIENSQLVIEGLTTNIKFERKLGTWYLALDTNDGEDLPVHHFLDADDYRSMIRRMAYHMPSPPKQK